MDNPSAIYVHIPFCKARCAYCAFSSCVNMNLQDDYFQTLCDEIFRADGTSNIKTLYWGGGTPSVASVANLQKLYFALCKKFDLSNVSEFTVECNPESTSREMLCFLKEIGVNRLSFGLQSVNNDTLRSIGRLHSYEIFLKALDMAFQLGFQNINADLILGLPETIEQFCKSVETVCKLPLKHISLYALEVHDENKLFKKKCDSFGYTEDDLADMYDFALNFLEKNGFLRYEVSNFAQKGFESRHNINYWREGGYFGFGASASGFIKGARYGNVFDIADYIASGAKKLEYREDISAEEEMNEYVMLGLRLVDGIDVDDFARRFDKNFFLQFPRYQNLVERGFLRHQNNRIFISRDKFYVLNSILTELL